MVGDNPIDAKGDSWLLITPVDVATGEPWLMITPVDATYKEVMVDDTIDVSNREIMVTDNPG